MISALVVTPDSRELVQTVEIREISRLITLRQGCLYIYIFFNSHSTLTIPLIDDCKCVKERLIESKMSQSRQSGDAFMTGMTDKQEKQRIMQELKRRKLFESDMPFHNMKELLEAIIASEELASKEVDQSVTENKSPEPLPLASQMTWARALSSPASTERKSTSPELTSSQCNKSLSQEKQVDSQDEQLYSPPTRTPYNKEPKDSQNSNINKNRQVTNVESTCEGTNDNKRTNQRPQTRQEDKVPKFKINPLENSNGKKDSPLQPHYRSFDNEACNEGGSGSGGGGVASDNSDKAIARLCNHLRQIAEILHTQHRSSVESNFQWGSPIKIVEAKGALDRTKIIAGDTSESTEDTRAMSNNFSNETSRRRRISANKMSIYDYGDGSNDERDDEKNNSDDDFQLGAKRKKIVPSASGKKLTSSKTAGRKSGSESVATKSEPVESTSIGGKPEDSAMCLDVSYETTVNDDEGSGQPPKKIQRSKSAETETPYPRRVVPPKPGMKSARIRARKPLLFDQPCYSRARKETNEDKHENSRVSQRGKSSLGLLDMEIAEALELNEDDEKVGDKDNDDVTPVNSDIADIRPLRVSGRMKIQSQRLVQIQEKEKESENIRREQERIKEETIRRGKIERVQQRVREEKEKQRQLEESEKRKVQEAEKWKAFMAERDKGRPVERTELHPEGRSRNNEAPSDARENNLAINQNDDECISDSSRGREPKPEQVRCPICSRCFTINEIEAHAGACEEYDANSPGVSRSSSPSLTPPRTISTFQRSNNSSKLLECEICSKFTTYKGKEFENHMTECINRRQKYGQSFIPDAVIEVPTSPLRTVRTISEQTDSEINYASQFVPKTKSNKNIGKKRKR